VLAVAGAMPHQGFMKEVICHALKGFLVMFMSDYFISFYGNIMIANEVYQF